MADGLIAAAIGGFGKALSSIGEMEAKKQNEAKLRRELMDMESEERLRLDEVMFERKMKRLPQEATATAEANVAGEVAGLEAASKTNLPALKANAAATSEKLGYTAKTAAGVPEAAAIYEATTASEKLKAREKFGVVEAEAKEAVRQDVAKLVAENGSEKAKLLAQQKVNGRLAELAAITDTKLNEAEARAKYSAFMTDLRIAKELGVDVAEAERDAEKEKARIDALIKKGVPKAKADYAATERVESARALLDKNVAEEEAKFLAKQELAKVQAMIAQGVPEAEAKLLAAKWRAGKTQRDEAAAEKVQQEIAAEIETAKRLAKDPTYLKNKRAIEAATRFTTGGSSKSEDKTETSLDLERKLKASTQKLALALGVDDNKVNEAYKALSKKALTDPKAKEKLVEIQPLFDAVNTRLTALENYTVKGKSENKSGTGTAGGTTYKIGEERILSDGANKGKTVVWDGTKWNLKK